MSVLNDVVAEAHRRQTTEALELAAKAIERLTDNVIDLRERVAQLEAERDQ